MVDPDVETVFLLGSLVAAIAFSCVIPLRRIACYVQIDCKYIARNSLKSQIPLSSSPLFLACLRLPI